MKSLEKISIIAPAVLPNVVEVVAEHRAIPKERRSEKIYLQLWGVAFLLFAYDAGMVWYLSWYWWAPAIYVGGHLTAGDYRRVLVAGIAAAISDLTGLVGQAGKTIKAAREALDAAAGKEDT